MCALHPRRHLLRGPGTRSRRPDNALKTRGTCQADVRPLLIATGLIIAPKLLDEARVVLVDAAATDNAA
jgi:hypothetical protein